MARILFLVHIVILLQKKRLANNWAENAKNGLQEADLLKLPRRSQARTFQSFDWKKAEGKGLSRVIFNEENYIHSMFMSPMNI